MYSTTSDIARFMTALMRGGANGHGPVLDPAALARMFDAHYRPDPRLPGWGLGFIRAAAGAHRVVGHDGFVPGFNSKFLVAPDDGVGVVAFTNGSKGAFMWLQTELTRPLRDLLGVPDEVVRTDMPHHPEIWTQICGRYRLPPTISDLRGRLAAPAGVQVLARGGHLVIRALAPVPALYRGLPLHPDDEDDPHVFRLDLSELGMSSARVVWPRCRQRRGGHPCRSRPRGSVADQATRCREARTSLAAAMSPARRPRPAEVSVSGRPATRSDS